MPYMMPTTPEEENYTRSTDTRSTDTQSATAASAASDATERTTIATHADRIVKSFIATLDKDDRTSPYSEEERILLREQPRDNLERDLFEEVSVSLRAANSLLESMGRTVGSMDNVVFTPMSIVAGGAGNMLMEGNLQGEGWLGNVPLVASYDRAP